MKYFIGVELGVKNIVEIVLERICSKEIEPPELKTAGMGSASVIIGATMLGLYKEVSAIEIIYPVGAFFLVFLQWVLMDSENSYEVIF